MCFLMLIYPQGFSEWACHLQHHSALYSRSFIASSSSCCCWCFAAWFSHLIWGHYPPHMWPLQNQPQFLMFSRSLCTVVIPAFIGKHFARHCWGEIGNSCFQLLLLTSHCLITSSRAHLWFMELASVGFHPSNRPHHLFLFWHLFFWKGRSFILFWLPAALVQYELRHLVCETSVSQK